MLHAVIMAGGAGTRFWPASRRNRPKQLLNLAGQQTMIQATVDRLGDLVPADRVLIVTNQRLVEPIAQQLPELPADAILGEPCKRDTAPCIGLAAMLLLKTDPEATMVVMPADHVIQPNAVFQQTVTQAAALVDAVPERIVTFGIRPNYPAETFGYIERGDLLATEDAGSTAPVYRVQQFREKPNSEMARHYLETGRFLWNSGIFIWRARTIVEALQKFEPDMYGCLATIVDVAGADSFREVFDVQFAAIQGKSIDYAVMEHYDDVVVIEAPFQWDDVGSWLALGRMRGTDENGNTLVGRNLVLRTRNAIVQSDGDHLVSVVGLDNVIVVHTPDATLVASQDDEQSIREMVQLLEQQGWDQYL